MPATQKIEAPKKSTPKVSVNPAVAIAEELKNTLPEHRVQPVVEEIGQVVYIGDGICKISGLPSVRMEDVVHIETEDGDTVPALVLGMSEIIIEAVVLSDYTKIRQGNTVKSKGDVLTIAGGEGMLGRIVTPLGEPLDGKGPIMSHTQYPVERQAPGVAKRAPVADQFECGVLVVDTLVPLGKGQRELVIGDRKSGKTRLMANFIINQKGKGITCVYVAIGAQKAKIRGLQEMLEKAGAMEYTCIVMGGSDYPPSLNYIAPYAGTAIAESFLYEGKDAIIIYDDLSRHAKAYRQMSLLLKRSPGRDAYPGDIFYLHSRLLERSAKLHDKLGGGSLTGFPMAETQNGDNSEYIVTNLMSITDGHIFLDVNLMHEGVLPAVNAGSSVSRIGGGVQPPALRKTGELASSQMARFNEVKSFETLNTEINEETEREIKRGKRLLVIFGQDSKMSLANDEKTLLMYLVVTGMSDNVEVADLKVVRDELVPFYRAGNYAEYKEKSVVEKDLKVLDPMIKAIVADYLKTCEAPTAKYLLESKDQAAEGKPIVPDPGAVAEAEKQAAEDKAKEEKKDEKKEGAK
ncbi:F0F1 ATP synthase subunit alpha [soil metagenome]